MPGRVTASALAVELVASSGSVFAQQVLVEPAQRFHPVLDVLTLSTLERERNDAAGQGFRHRLKVTPTAPSAERR